MKRLLPFLLLPLLAACTDKTPTIVLHAPNDAQQINLDVEIADEDEERIIGLSNRERLEGTDGMLFVFPNEDVLTFWMRDTDIPLDILFFNAAGQYINAHTMEPCEEDPCQRYSSAEPATMALEVEAGYREARNIGVGWYIDPATIAEISDAK